MTDRKDNVTKFSETLKDADPFDPESLKLGTYDEGFATEKVLLTVPVRKPGKLEFFRVHDDPAYRIDTVVIELEQETFLIDRTLWPLLASEVKPVRLYTCCTRSNVIFLWPVRLPGPDGRSLRWWDTAHEVASLAQTTWVRCTANFDLAGYDMHKASGNLPPPKWPPQSFRDLLALAFKGRAIQTADHHVLKRLQGEI